MDKDLDKLLLSLVENYKRLYCGKPAKKAKSLIENGQNPTYFFISCSDSRYDPNRLPMINHGDAFMARHIAALVPPHDAPESVSIAAVIDFAVDVLKVKHIIIKGHTHCGGVKGLVEGGTTGALDTWLGTARDVMDHVVKSDSVRETCDLAEKESIRWSLENLKNYPSVKKALSEGSLQIHGWRFDIETGAVEAFNEETQSFGYFFDPERDAENDNPEKCLIRKIEK